MLTVDDLSAKKGRLTLFQHVRFELLPGQWLFLSGGNGSGKTTLLRILCGLSRPEDGRVLWRGADVHQAPEQLHQEMIYMGHALGMKEEMSALENLRFNAHMMGLTFEPITTREVLSSLGLRGREHLPLRVLSQGQKRRVALAKLLLYPVPLWVLDEPFVALDAAGLSVMTQAIEAHLGREGTLIYTSHQRVHINAPGQEVSLQA
jgi:heme exporter protein A